MPERERVQLPLKPSGSSLASHVAALDLLAARIDSLPARSSWPVRVPVNSKASFHGNVVHTDEMKAYVGSDQWVGVTAREAAIHVRERRSALLEDQARIMEGQKPRSLHMEAKEGQHIIKTKDIKFDSLLGHPGHLPKFIPRKVEQSDTLSRTAQLVQSDDVEESLHSLVDLVGEHLKDNLSISEPAEEPIVNDDGLPIHEIRETLDGNTLGPTPEPSGMGEVTFDENDNYWTPEAVARRQELRRRMFHESSDSEGEDLESTEQPVDSKMAMEDVQESSPGPATLTSQLADHEPSPATMPASPRSSLTAPPLSPNAQPKSILKPPARKKSVTFDAGTKLPAESPPDVSTKAVVLPVAEKVTETPMNGVPVIPPPKPGKGYGGLRAGFLTTPSSKTQVPSSEPKQEEPKKASLFAQRRAENPSLPKFSDSKPMAAMKTAVVEKPLAAGQPIRTDGSSASASLPPVVGSTPATSSAPVLVVDNDSDPDDYGDLGEFSDDEEDEYALDEAMLRREVALEYHRRQHWQRPVDEDEVDPEEADLAAVMAIPRVSSVTGGTEENPLRIVNPTPDDLSQFLRVGRDADGQLVFEQPLVDSGSESDGEGEDSLQKRERRARREETMRRLLAGTYEDLPGGSDADADRRDREAQWAETLPPSVQAAPTPTANDEPTALPVRESSEPQPPQVPTSSVPSKHSRTERDEVDRVPLGGFPAAVDTPAPPKKVSRFKAARQGL